MKSLTSEECAVAHNFNDYYKFLNDTHLTEGVTGITDIEEIHLINAGIATALTILKGKEVEQIDYFA